MSATGTAARLPDSAAFLAEEMVHDNDIAGDQRGHQNLLDISKEQFAIDGSMDQPRRFDPIMPQGHNDKATMKVIVLQCPYGTLLSSLAPSGLQPRSGAMLVLVQSLPRLSCFVAGDWRDGIRLRQAIDFLRERLVP
jgi:hypothetical protein